MNAFKVTKDLAAQFAQDGFLLVRRLYDAEEMDLRLNRQGLLQSLHNAMNRVADLSRLAA